MHYACVVRGNLDANTPLCSHPEGNSCLCSAILSCCAWSRFTARGIQQWRRTFSGVGLDPCLLHEYDSGKDLEPSLPVLFSDSVPCKGPAYACDADA